LIFSGDFEIIGFMLSSQTVLLLRTSFWHWLACEIDRSHEVVPIDSSDSEKSLSSWGERHSQVDVMIVSCDEILWGWSIILFHKFIIIIVLSFPY
jgi:hypothetical protein